MRNDLALAIRWFILGCFVALVILVLNACGTDGKNGTDGQDGEPGPKGETGETGAPGNIGPRGPAATSPVPLISLEGYYYLPNGGYLELLENNDGRILIYGTQRIYSKNKDKGLALHPNLPAGPHLPRDGSISGEYNTNYNSTTNDLEKDGSTSNITGTRKTFWKIYLDNNNLLRIKLIVYSSSGLSIEVDRVVKEEDT